MSDKNPEVLYSFSPIYNCSSRLLILGTMASPASLRAGMYYGHPQNAFWRIIRDLTGEPLPTLKEQRYDLLLRHGIALWDTLRACEREGAADSAIRNVIPNDVFTLIKECPMIQSVFLNGSAAYKFFKKYHAAIVNRPYFLLPSTSPVNARGGFEAKLNAWRAIEQFMM